MGFYLTDQATDTATEGSVVRKSHPGAKTPIGAPFLSPILSTKYWDDATGLGNWGRRYYHPDLGGWLSRDPIAEEGGDNDYMFSRNSAVNYIDFLGYVPLFPILLIPCAYVKNNELRPYYNLFPWFDSDLPGEGDSCCCESSIKMDRKDLKPTGIYIFGRTFHFRTIIEEMVCIGNIEYIYQTCWRKPVTTSQVSPDYVGGAIPESWMQLEYDLTIWYGLRSSMESGFYVKWQECIDKKWTTKRDHLGYGY